MTTFTSLSTICRALCWLLLLLPLAALGASNKQPLRVAEVQVSDAVITMYQCAGGASFAVNYWNASNGQSFALLPVHGVPMLLVSVMSADGVRYQSGFVTWWSKGRGGDLYDARNNANEPMFKECKAL